MAQAYDAPAHATHAETQRLLAQFCSSYAQARDLEGAAPTAIDGLTVMRHSREGPTNHMLLRPVLCVVLQGAKWTMLGSKRFTYRSGQALVVCAEMPTTGRVIDASSSAPYLALAIEFDLAIMRDVLERMQAPPAQGDARSLFVTEVDGALADAVLRFVRLLDEPDSIPVLYPSVMREICYRLLNGTHGGEIARMVLANERIPDVVGAIHTLRDRFAEPIRIEELAAAARMSPSAFHRQFKAVTSMTPLQYQKRLRLLEARRLMLSDAANVETAAFRVGYESASQFSREYTRMFGKPPRRDVSGGS